MIRSFRDRDTERLYRQGTAPPFRGIADAAMRRLQILDDAASLPELRSLRSNRLEALSGDRSGQYRIRINRQWRICFRWADGAPYDVEIVDYHS